jgi:hypothetical protein
MDTPTVTLRTGAEVSAAAVKSTMIALRRLAEGGMTTALALYEARQLALDPAHDMWPGTAEALTALGLLKDSRLHDVTRDIVLAAVTEAGDLTDPHLPA